MRLFLTGRRRVGKFPLLSFLACCLLGAGPTHAAIVAVASFDNDLEGWTALACPNPGVCALGSAPLTLQHLASGGNPGGYVRAQDPSSSTAGRAAPPAAFSSLLAFGQTLSFDALVERNGGDGVYDSSTAPLVTIETPSGTLVFATDVLPTIDGGWQHYAVPLFDAAGWVLVTNGVRPLAAGEFESLFETRTRLSLIAEWLNDSADLDTGGLDNVTLSAVPLPAALPLFACALGIAALRRRAAR